MIEHKRANEILQTIVNHATYLEYVALLEGWQQGNEKYNLIVYTFSPGVQMDNNRVLKHLDRMAEVFSQKWAGTDLPIKYAVNVGQVAVWQDGNVTRAVSIPKEAPLVLAYHTYGRVLPKKEPAKV